MSSYLVIAGVSEALRRVLWQEISADPEVSQLVPSEDDIVFTNPTETARDTSNRMSLWLYQVTENEFLKNRPWKGGAGGNPTPPPLSLNLSYLLTPFANQANNVSTRRDEDHLVLGKILEVFHDNAVVVLRDQVSGIAEELRIVLKRVTLEELTRVWEALREPYRLSVCYQVSVVRVDSRRVSPQARVVERGSATNTLEEAS